MSVHVDRTRGLKFNQNQYEKASRTDLLNYIRCRGYHMFKKPGENEYRLVEHDSLTINPEKNNWFWHSRGIGGGPIQFLTEYEKMTLPEAVNELAGDIAEYELRVEKPKVSNQKDARKEEKNLELPERYKNNYRTFAYLNKTRRIDPKLIEHCMKEKLIYETKNISHHNAVFVGLNKEGVPKYANMRATLSYVSFRLDADGSDKDYAFNMPGTTESVKVFESPIDLLSYLTVYKIITDIKDHYIALGGLSSRSLDRYLRDYPEIKVINFCLDSDIAGQKALAKFKQQYEEQGYTVNVENVPSDFKDWNEYAVYKHECFTAQVEKQQKEMKETDNEK